MSTMWDPLQPTIKDLLDEIDEGRLALPQFQRPPVWTAKRNEIPFLIAVLLGRPTGSLLTLNYVHEPKQFPVHAIDGAKTAYRETADRLILDGQQRLTTLYRALRCGWIEEKTVKTEDGTEVPVVTVERMIVDVRSAAKDDELTEDHFSLEAGADASIEAMAKTGRLDFRTLGDEDDLDDWMRAYIRHFGEDDPDLERQLSRAVADAIPFLRSVLDYRFPELRLKQETEVGVVAEIFEHMNSRGQPLNRFDLMVARMYERTSDAEPPEYYDLRESWLECLDKAPSLQRLGISEDDGLMPLQLIAWQYSRKVTTASVLRLPSEVVLARSSARPGLGLESAVAALDEAGAFLIDLCGVTSERLLPQSAMLLPIANLILRRSVDSAAKSLSDADLKKWFFASCFSQPAPRYYGGVNSRVAEDCRGLEAWADSGVAPEYVAAFGKASIEALDFSQPMSRERNILGLAAMAIVVQQGAKDWRQDQRLVRQEETVHLHHMVPEERLKGWWPGSGENRQKRLNIANFAPISAKINQRYGAEEPGKVLDSLEGHAHPILTSHGVNEGKLRAGFESEEAFAAFCADRSERLKTLICQELGLL